MLVYGFFRIDKELIFPGKWALVPVLGSTLIILTSQQAWINRKILSNRIFVWFDLISFPLYLWHWVLLSFERVVESEVPSRNISIAAVMLSIFLAWLTYKLVECPIRFGRYNKIKVAILVVSMSLSGASGYCVYQFDIKSPAAKRILLSSNQLGWTIPVGSEEQIALCRNKFPERSSFTSTLRDDNFCYLQKNSTPNVLLIGDSMNLSLFPGLSKFDDLNVLMLSASSAAPFYNVRTTELGDNIRLNNYLMTNQALDYAISNPGIKVVLLSSLSAPFLADKNSIFKIWDVNALNEADQHKIFIKAMTNTLQRLLAANKRVIYVLPNPYLDFDPRLCLSDLRPFRLTNKRGSCSRGVESCKF